MELVNEAKLGVTKDTEVEKEVNQEYKGETWEVGAYLAMARQAERDGYPEIALALRQIALDEAEHAAHFAELNGKISASTKENLEKMLQGEIEANQGKKEAATKAKEAGLDEAHDFFDESSRDEGRHANTLKGLLQRYFNS